MRRPSTCTQSQCLLRDEETARALAADWIVRLMSGETIDGAEEVSVAQQIRDQALCRRCALDVMRDKAPLPTVDEWESATEFRRTYRRARRDRRHASG